MLVSDIVGECLKLTLQDSTLCQLPISSVEISYGGCPEQAKKSYHVILIGNIKGNIKEILNEKFP